MKGFQFEEGNPFVGGVGVKPFYHDAKVESRSLLDEGPLIGFRVTFRTGLTLSVQWSKYNYCERQHHAQDGPSDTAEVALIVNDKLCPEELYIDGSHSDQVHGWLESDKVLQLLHFVSQRKETEWTQELWDDFCAEVRD